MTRTGRGRLFAVLLGAAIALPPVWTRLAPSVRAADPASGESQRFASVPGGDLHSVLPRNTANAALHVMPFALQRQPVTNREFLAFVRTHTEWQRGRVSAAHAQSDYLQRWAGPLEFGPDVIPDQPVTNVSWFAARAYCESHNARLPSWNEWELAAAADEHTTDARRDTAWRVKALEWFSRPANSPLPIVGRSAPNVYGVYDLHGLVWEWVQDFDTLFASAENAPHANESMDMRLEDRHQGEPTTGHEAMAMSPGAMAMSCGGAALALADPENYPVILRLAMLSSLQRNSTTANLGFRCARSATVVGQVPGAPP